MRSWLPCREFAAACSLIIVSAVGCKKDASSNSAQTPSAAPQTQPSMSPAPMTMPATAPSGQIPQGDPDTLAAGDLLDVEISDLSPSGLTADPVHIAADGTVRLYYLDQPILVAGKDRFEAQAAISEAYERMNLIRHANILVRRLQAAGNSVPTGPIQPWDLVRIASLDLSGPDTEEIRISRVNGKGMLGLAYAGPIRVTGMTEAQVADEIVKKYRDANLVQHAAVSVLKLEAAPENAAQTALADGPIHPVPEILKPLYFHWPDSMAPAAQKH